MKGCQCSQSLYGLVAPHHGEQGVALSTRRPNNQTIGGFFVSKQRKIRVEMNDGILTIIIQCKHGALYACNSLSETDAVAVRYMVEEIQNDKFATIDLQYSEIETVVVDQ